MTLESAQLAPVCQIPELDRAVVAAGRQHPSVTAECQSVDESFVSFKRSQFSSGLHVPHFDRKVQVVERKILTSIWIGKITLRPPVSRSQPLAVGAPRETVDAHGERCLQRTQLLSGTCISERDRRVEPRCARENASIRTKGQRRTRHY